MKKILLDECVPRKLKNHLSGHECVKVPEAGLAGKKNGELLLLAEEMGFDIFLTLDRGIEYEQNLTGRRLAIVLVRAKSNRLADLLVQLSEIVAVLGSVETGQLVHLR